MTYREEAGLVSLTVHELLTDGATAPSADLPAALAGHASLVAMLTELHTHLTDGVRPPRREDVTELERRPIALLGKMLKNQPSIIDQPFSDILQSQPAGAAGKAWRELAKSATLAQFEWQHARPETLPRGDAAWSEIADLAYLAEAVAILDVDVADSLSAAGRFSEASRFRAAGTSGLRLAAREVHETSPLPAACPQTPTCGGWHRPESLSPRHQTTCRKHSPASRP